MIQASILMNSFQNENVRKKVKERCKVVPLYVKCLEYQGDTIWKQSD